jgi:hypothetical protein
VIEIHERLDERRSTFLAHHVVVPAAVIAMVASFLSYLVDVRSAFLGGGPQLKWIGFCFAVATVLIERYRRTSGDTDTQGCYTIALGVATLSVMLIEPWESRPVGFGEKLANLLIVAAVWRFATKLTQGLSPEVGRPAWTGLRLYGMERIRAEAWQREKAKETGIEPRKPEPKAEIPPNPAVSVARLAALALAAFALGEPTLLDATPQTGIRALAAVIVFLFATGVVLAAGSSLDTLRRAETQGGRVSPGLVPARLALGALLLILILASALAVPGLRFQGIGRLRPPATQGKGTGEDRGYQQSDQAGKLSKRPEEEDPNREGRIERGDPDARLRSRQGSDFGGGPAGKLVSTLSGIGRWLIIPLVLAILAGAAWALWRLWPQLGAWRSRMGERWRKLVGWLDRLRNRFRRPVRIILDPFDNLEALDRLPPREAVLAAYQRFLALLDLRGYARPPRSTPYEVLNALPFELRKTEEPARTLTELYVRAAYSDEPVEPGAGQAAIFCLKGMRGLLSSPGRP